MVNHGGIGLLPNMPSELVLNSLYSASSAVLGLKALP